MNKELIPCSCGGQSKTLPLPYSFKIQAKKPLVDVAQPCNPPSLHLHLYNTNLLKNITLSFCFEFQYSQSVCHLLKCQNRCHHLYLLVLTAWFFKKFWGALGGSWGSFSVFFKKIFFLSFGGPWGGLGVFFCYFIILV